VDDEDDIHDHQQQGLGLDEPIIQPVNEEQRGEGMPPPKSQKKSTKKSVQFKGKLTASKESLKRPKTDKAEQAMLLTLHEIMQRHIEEVKAMGPLTEKDIPQLRDKWYTTCHDIMQGTPLHMPKVWKIHHEILLIEPDKRYKHRLPKCPDAMKTELMAKVKKYTTAGWWEPVQTNQAAPMLCVPKKNGKLHMLIICGMQ
jgi:hypothetical protein